MASCREGQFDGSTEIDEASELVVSRYRAAWARLIAGLTYQTDDGLTRQTIASGEFRSGGPCKVLINDDSKSLATESVRDLVGLGCG